MDTIDGLRLIHGRGVLWADVEGEVVLYDTDRSRAHLLSRSGSLLWPAFSSPVTVAELAEDVAAVFAIPVVEAAEQVGAFCTRLLDLNVLQDAAEGAEDQ